MFVEKVKPEQWEYAARLIAYYNFGMRGIGDGNEYEQLVGMIGQTVVADLLGLARPDGTAGFDDGVDFLINGRRVDVKTMTRTTEVKNDYVHNLIGYQKNFDVDYYLFTSYNKMNRNLTICGCIDKPTFFNKADYFKPGVRRYRSNGTYFINKAPLYEIRQNELIQIQNPRDISTVIL